MNWFAEKRIDWIAEMLRVYGFVQRKHIMRKFRVSTPQASLDLKKFQERFPDLVEYDSSKKMYVATFTDEVDDSGE